MKGRKTQPSSDMDVETVGFDSFEVRLGDLMRGERATLSKSLLDVQRELKIKANYIAAVENADPSVFESPGFIAGYVRSYARYLGMDPEWAYKQFCAESGFSGVDGLSGTATQKKTTTDKKREDLQPLASFTPAEPSIFDYVEPRALGSMAVLFSLIGLIGYGAWSVLQEVQRVQFAPIDQAPGVVAEVDTMGSGQPGAGDTQLGEDGFSASSADALDRLYRPQVLEAPLLSARDGPIASLDPEAVGALVDTRDNKFSPDISDAEPAPVAQVLKPANPDLMIFAVRPAWVQISSGDGAVLFEKVLDAGESYVLPQSDQAVFMRAGNSGSVYFSMQDGIYGPAGGGTSVVKGVLVGQNEIKQNYAQADIDADPALADAVTAIASANISPKAE